MMSNCRNVVVIGGGIAGISCIEALIQDYEKDTSRYNKITLIVESYLIKKVKNYRLHGRNLESFEVEEQDINDLDLNLPDGLSFSILIGSVESINPNVKLIVYKSLQDDQCLETSYDILNICIGSKPQLLDYTARGSNPQVDERVIVIRDTTTIEEFKEKLSKCRRLAVVGNGGIALELISRVSNCEKVWIIRDESLGSIFFDSEASKFILGSIDDDASKPLICTPTKNVISSSTRRGHNFGPSLGPSWADNHNFVGNLNINEKVDVIYRDEIVDVIAVKDGQYPLEITTKQGRKVTCDLIATAIGVKPNSIRFIGNSPEIDEETGGILIDEEMRTSLRDIYAAGDVACCSNWPENELWFQMRLWTQARLMGHYSGRCIASHCSGQDALIYSNFDCFTHCTRFFNFKVVLLGNYNSQSVAKALVRVKPGKEYIKILINHEGRIIGATLIGETGLEETIENLIHDKIDVSSYSDHLLEELVDIEDYFD